MSLKEAKAGTEYIIDSVATNDGELDSFLFSLGCYRGEKITVITKLRSGLIISIKDGRYSIDKELAKAISVA